MGKIFGAPLNENVKNQLEHRRTNLINGKEINGEFVVKNDTVLHASKLHNQGSYIRCVSGVNGLEATEEEYLASVKNAQRSPAYIEALNAYFADDKKDNVLASMNILSGGTTFQKVAQKEDGNHYLQEYRRDGLKFSSINETPTRSSYEYSDVGGFVPMMGITDFTIKSKSQFGTLREAEIKIKAWSPEQLDILEKLYFKPGFTMLVEWGAAAYFDETGNWTTEINTLTKSFLSGKKTIKKLQSLAADITKKSGNNYDAMFGKVINFSWDYSTDGSYDCSIKIMGKGEVLESIKSTIYTGYDLSSHRSFTNNNSVQADKDDKDLLLEIFKALTNTAEQDRYLQKFFPKGKLKVYRSALKDTKNSGTDEEDETESTAYEYFITLRDLLYIINLEIMSKDSSGAGETRFNLDFSRQKYQTFPGHISGNPYICGIPYIKGNIKLKTGGQFPDTHSFLGKGFKGNAKVPKELKDAAKMTSSNSEADLSSPLALLVNLTYLQELQRAAVKNLQENDKETSIFQFLSKILKDISVSLGGVNSFDLDLDKAENEWYIIDRNLYDVKRQNKDKKEMAVVDIMGLGSTVTNFGLSSKISSKMSSMLSIAAAAGSNKMKGQDNFVQFNNGAVDRYAKEPKKGPKVDKHEFPKESMQNAATRKDAKIAIGKAYYNYATSKKEDGNSFSSIATTHRTMMQFLLKMQKINSRDTSAPEAPNMLLPIEMNITMRGVAGLIVGEAFRIPDEILPSRYRDRVAFVITGVSHSIGGDNVWMCDIKTNMFMLPVLNDIQDAKEYAELEQIKEEPVEEEQEEQTSDTPNVDKLRAVIQAAKFIEKGTELGNGGDITEDTLKLGTALVNTVKEEAPGIKLRFTAGNDMYHQNLTKSKSRHKKGRALDFTISPYSSSNYQKVLAIVQGFAAGNSAKKVRFIDEYKKMTVNANGVHIHISWGSGTEGQVALREAVTLANQNKIKKYFV